jgi:hypothetical protein
MAGVIFIMSILLYLIGLTISVTLYGFYNAVTIYYTHKAFNSEILFQIYKVIEFLIVIWFTHQVLKRHLFQKMGLGKASIESLKLPKLYFIKAVRLIKKVS